VSAVAPVPSQHRLQPLPAEATRVLYERYSGRIFGYCLGLLGSREDAEDAVQTTFLNAQRGLGRGVVPQYELAWLFKIAQNVCRTRHESAGRRGRVETARDLDSLQDVLATPERSSSVSVRELTRALAGIPERQRRALLLREWRGLSYEEVATQLGLSVSAVEALLFRARRSVAEQLEQTGPRQRRGTAASVVALFRWLFQGGAAPLKLAAATAVVATTATVGSAPLTRSHAPAPAQPSPQVDVFRADARGKERAQRAVSSGARPAPSRSNVAPAGDHSPAASAITPAPSPAGARPESSSSPPSSDPSTVNPPVPSVTDPAVTVPAVSVPNASLPDVSPIPSLPAVELPVESVPLPDLPRPEPPKLP
jgi:RNA polymerase sigma-70 factor, ECF subfamily